MNERMYGYFCIGKEYKWSGSRKKCFHSSNISQCQRTHSLRHSTVFLQVRGVVRILNLWINEIGICWKEAKMQSILGLLVMFCVMFDSAISASTYRVSVTLYFHVDHWLTILRISSDDQIYVMNHLYQPQYHRRHLKSLNRRPFVDVPCVSRCRAMRPQFEVKLPKVFRAKAEPTAIMRTLIMIVKYFMCVYLLHIPRAEPKSSNGVSFVRNRRDSIR